MKDYYMLQHAHLEADETTLTARTDEIRRLPLEQIAGLHLLAGYTLTSGVLDLASRGGFPIHVYGFHGTYRGSFFPPPVNSTASPLVGQVREHLDPTLRLGRAKEILDAAHTAMNTMLEPLGLRLPPYRVEGQDLDLLRLSEARLRKEYYALCDTFLPSHWSIVRRERRPPKRPADALLGFANGILYAKTTGWIHRAGLDPRVGYLHGDARASNPLSLDLAEILKPFVSEAALLVIAASGHERSLITEVGDGCYLNEKGRKEVIRAMEGLLSTETSVEVFDRRVSLGRVGELIPVKLHRAIVTESPAVYPLPACTLSSSTTRTLNEQRTSVEPS